MTPQTVDYEARRADAELLRVLTNPRTVALVGASGSTAKLTARPQRFLQQHGYRGRIVPVNPGREEVLGLPAIPSVEAIPESIEHAYVLLDTHLVLNAVEQCARAAVPVVSVLASGFAEAGEEGRALQSRLVDLAHEAGMTLLGPNSMGVADTRSGFVCTTNAAFAAETLSTGRLAVISQSGSLMGALLSRGEALGIGFSTMVSVGNEAHTDTGRIGRLLVDDPDTDAILLCLETMRDSDGFAAFAEAARAAGMPVLAYLLGRSEEGLALPVSHTGSLTGSAAAFESFLAACGVRRVNVFEALIEAAPALVAAGPRLGRRPPSATVVATTGGGGAMVIDRLAMAGVAIASCGDATRQVLRTEGISMGEGKLVDVTLAGTNHATMKRVVSALASDAATGVLIVTVGSSAKVNPELAVTPIIEAVAELGEAAAPVFAFLVPDAPESLRLLNRSGIPAFRTVESCAEAVRCLFAKLGPQPRPAARQSAEIARLLEHHGSGLLDEVDSRAVLEAAGLASPPCLVLDVGDPLPDPLPFAFPVIAKLVSADLPHKTDAGAIALDIGNREDIVRAIARMMEQVARRAPNANLRRVLIQPVCHGVAELLVGLSRDPRVGPVVTLGMGGIFAEVYRDTCVCPAPINLETARDMLAELRGEPLLAGFRGKPRGDLTALASMVSAMSHLALYPRIAEAEVNPLLVLPEGSGAVMLDALVRLED